MQAQCLCRCNCSFRPAAAGRVAGGSRQDPVQRLLSKGSPPTVRDLKRFSMFISGPCSAAPPSSAGNWCGDATIGCQGLGSAKSTPTNMSSWKEQLKFANPFCVSGGHWLASGCGKGGHLLIPAIRLAPVPILERRNIRLGLADLPLRSETRLGRSLSGMTITGNQTGRYGVLPMCLCSV